MGGDYHSASAPVNSTEVVIPHPSPRIPWQLTGNHWLSIPCVHPGTGAVHAVGITHRGLRACVEFAGSPDFVSGDGPPLLRPTVHEGASEVPFTERGLAWERALGWLPTFTGSTASLVIRGAIFAPYGKDADIAGAVYLLTVENRAANARELVIGLEGTLGHRQQRVRTPRRFDDTNRVHALREGIIILEGSALPGVAALAVAAAGSASVSVIDGPAPMWQVRQSVMLEAGERRDIAFYLAAGPERDGAEAIIGVLRRRGWQALLSATTGALQQLEQLTGNDSIDRLMNRNLLFAYFYGVTRALDDAHFYVVRTRVPWNTRGYTVRDWDALSWTIPAVQLADAPLARELILRMCELHGYAPGRGVHYFEGTLFEPGFTLEGASAYALAVERYIAATGDDQIVEEPVIADTLYLSHDDIAARRDSRIPLYSTEVTLAGDLPEYPYTLHGNAVVGYAMDVFKRTLDEKTAEKVQDPEGVRAALVRHFTVSSGSRPSLAAAIDLSGQASHQHDALGTPYWLPLYEAVAADDSSLRRTLRPYEEQHGGPFALECARLLGPRGGETLEWLRRAPLDGGIAPELVDAEGKATGNGGDAALAGLLAATLWFAVHARGLRL
jgi:hypothetical protein